MRTMRPLGLRSARRRARPTGSSSTMRRPVRSKHSRAMTSAIDSSDPAWATVRPSVVVTRATPGEERRRAPRTGRRATRRASTVWTRIRLTSSSRRSSSAWWSTTRRSATDRGGESSSARPSRWQVLSLSSKIVGNIYHPATVATLASVARVLPTIPAAVSPLVRGLVTGPGAAGRRARGVPHGALPRARRRRGEPRGRPGRRHQRCPRPADRPPPRHALAPPVGRRRRATSSASEVTSSPCPHTAYGSCGRGDRAGSTGATRRRTLDWRPLLADVGRGDGLTPRADDVLCGALLAARALGIALPASAPAGAHHQPLGLPPARRPDGYAVSCVVDHVTAVVAGFPDTGRHPRTRPGHRSHLRRGPPRGHRPRPALRHQPPAGRNPRREHHPRRRAPRRLPRLGHPAPGVAHGRRTSTASRPPRSPWRPSSTSRS